MGSVCPVSRKERPEDWRSVHMMRTMSMSLYDMSYLSIQKISPSAICIRNMEYPFPHMGVMYRGYPCELYETLVRIQPSSIEYTNRSYKIRLNPDDIQTWLTLEGSISDRIPTYICSLRQDDLGHYIHLPYSRVSQSVLQDRPGMIHLRVRRITFIKDGYYPLLYVYVG